MKLNIRSIIRKPSTEEEAIEKRDTAKVMALGSLGIAVFCTVLGAVIERDILESLGMIAIVAAVVFFALWCFARIEVFRFQNIFCECGERYLFPNHVIYEIKGEQISSSKDRKNNDVTSHTSTKVTFCCKCRKCGKVHTFDAAFVTEKRVFNEHGVLLSTKSYPLYKQLEDFFHE